MGSAAFLKHGATWSRRQPLATLIILSALKSPVEPLELEEALCKSIVYLITGVLGPPPSLHYIISKEILFGTL